MDRHFPVDQEDYAQRASAAVIVTEATQISQQGQVILLPGDSLPRKPIPRHPKAVVSTTRHSHSIVPGGFDVTS